MGATKNRPPTSLPLRTIARDGDWVLTRYNDKVELEHLHPVDEYDWKHRQSVTKKNGLCMACGREAPVALQAMWLVTK